ncbi:uncharacterized protein LACBIDRAFT_306820 [Laccaria bicolor S238N-H82]|uniref:Predicted protein n=1 Tax=Laccaria bicolor (strain S238N-H82 / ATCC MYA-4686) TaxID=486041 RepID=B0DNT1_LACBS|nr:uncharacterized protein LACBIDRAFT_306820 [Laccaria bicolor S238N-H82]EDR03777.1 predicted protein [Laccaria bicolor S238N-H82]|eukprot:XP_001885630.1 predicted protein [Laccaria bicolor S238N-H82]
MPICICDHHSKVQGGSSHCSPLVAGSGLFLKAELYSCSFTRALRGEIIVTAQGSAAGDNDKPASSDYAYHPIPPCAPPRKSPPGSIETGITTTEETPMTQVSHGPDRGYGTIEEQATYLREELERHKLEAGDKFGRTTFLDTATKEQLEKFFADTNHFTWNPKNRWNGIPEVPTSEKKLYHPYVAIISGILSYFEISARQMIAPAATLGPVQGAQAATLNMSRDALIPGSGLAEGTAPHDMFATKLSDNIWVDNITLDTFDVLISGSGLVEDTTPHDTHATKLSHIDSTTLSTSPDILISGSGVGFWPNSKLVQSLNLSSKASKKSTYRGCASPLEIKTEKTYSFWDNLIQIAVYARQCFIQQESRFFVYSAILTETFIQLFQFDRAGVMYSQHSPPSSPFYSRYPRPRIPRPRSPWLGYKHTVVWRQAIPDYANARRMSLYVMRLKISRHASFVVRSVVEERAAGISSIPKLVINTWLRIAGGPLTVLPSGSFWKWPKD